MALLAVKPESPINIGKTCFLASEEQLTLKAYMQKSVGKALFSNEGLFVLKAEGEGLLAVRSAGAILSFDLAEGEQRAVDNGHVVAWDANMTYRIGWASEAGKDPNAPSEDGALQKVSNFVKQNILSGEGLMMFFTGPGKLWISG